MLSPVNVLGGGGGQRGNGTACHKLSWARPPNWLDCCVLWVGVAAHVCVPTYVLVVVCVCVQGGGIVVWGGKGAGVLRMIDALHTWHIRHGRELVLAVIVCDYPRQHPCVLLCG